MEHLIGTVRSRATSASLSLTIPHCLRVQHGFEKGDHFVVKIDEQERIIYEKLPGGEDHDAPTPASPAVPRHNRRVEGEPE